MSVDYNILFRSLQKKKLEYETALEAINQTFEELGLGVSTIVGHGQSGVEESTEVQRSGIRIKGELSFRGRDKAEEYFRLVDRDQDHFLSYEDMRAMEAFNHPYALIKDGHYQSSAAWAIAMLNEGVSVQRGYFLSTKSFLQHRQLVDQRQPLARELQVTGLGLLPAYLVHWAKLKQLCREAIASREVRISLAQADRRTLDDRLTLVELQEVLGNCDTPLTTPELMFFFRLLRVHQIAQKELLRTYAKRRLAQTDFPFETTSVSVQNNSSSNNTSANNSRSPSRSKSASQRNKRTRKIGNNTDDEEVREEVRLVTVMRSEDKAIEPEHVQQCNLNQSLAWLLRYFAPLHSYESNNLSVYQRSAIAQAHYAFDFNTFGRCLLSLRYRLTRGLRQVEHVCRFLFDFAGHFNDRLVFRDLSNLLYDRTGASSSNNTGGRHSSSRSVTGLSSLPNHLTETSVYKFSLSVGDAAVSGGGGGAGVGPDNNSNSNSVNLSGVSLHWKLARIDSVESAAKRLGGVPAGAGMVIALDLLCKDPANSPAPILSMASHLTDAEQWQAGATLLRAWLIAQFSDPLLKEHNVNYLGCNVLFTVSELDDAPVYRILVYYKRLVCVDRWLETLLLPFPLCDLLPACAGDLRTSLDLHRLIQTVSDHPDDTNNGSNYNNEQDNNTARNKNNSNSSNNNTARGNNASLLNTARSAASHFSTQTTQNSQNTTLGSARHNRHGSSSMSVRGSVSDLKERSGGGGASVGDGPSLNDLLHCQLSGTVGLRSRLVASLLQRLTAALSSGLSEAQTAYLQTQTSANSNPTTSSNDSSNGVNTSSVSDNSSVVTTGNTTVNTSNTNNNSNSSGMPPFTDANRRQTQKDDEEMRFRRWRSVYPHYAWLHRLSDYYTRLLRRWTSGACRWHYRSLYDLLSSLALTSDHFHQLLRHNSNNNNNNNINSSDNVKSSYFSGWNMIGSFSANNNPDSGSGFGSVAGLGFKVWGWVNDFLLLTPGAVSRHVSRLRHQWTLDLLQTHAMCAGQLSRMREEEMKLRRELLIHGSGNNNNNSNSNGADDSNDNSTQANRLLQQTQHLRSADSLQKQAQTEDFDRMVQSLRVLDLLQHHCVGLHSCELLVGKTRLTISGAGMDVCEALLPEAPPMLKTYATHEQDLHRLRSGHRRSASTTSK